MTALFLVCSHGNYEVMVKAFADVNAKAYVSYLYTNDKRVMQVMSL